MPQLAAVAAIISAAATAAKVGADMAGVGQPSSNTKATQEAMLKAQQDKQKQEQTMEQSMFKHFAPDAQAASGGALGSESLSALIAELAGTPGGVSEAQQTIFGNTESPELTKSNEGLSSVSVGG